MPIAANDSSIGVLTFALEDEVFAIEATRVREILDFINVTEVPGAQPFVNGLLNVRGKVVPLADLRIKLGMELRPPTIDSRIIVIETVVDGDSVTVGVRADKVFEVTELASASLEEAPRIGMRWRPEYIRCLGKRDPDVIIVLDVERVFSNIDAQEPALAGLRGQDRNAASALAAVQ